jgi:hypothetical protein
MFLSMYAIQLDYQFIRYIFMINLKSAVCSVVVICVLFIPRFLFFTWNLVTVIILSKEPNFGSLILLIVCFYSF